VSLIAGHSCVHRAWPLLDGSRDPRDDVAAVFKRCLLAVVVAALLLATAAQARVRLVRVTSPVSAGSYATLTVRVALEVYARKMKRERDTGARMDALVDWAQMGTNDAEEAMDVVSVDTEKEQEPAL
jgi:hypothetical protein